MDKEALLLQQAILPVEIKKNSTSFWGLKSFQVHKRLGLNLNFTKEKKNIAVVIDAHEPIRVFKGFQKQGIINQPLRQPPKRIDNRHELQEVPCSADLHLPVADHIINEKDLELPKRQGAIKKARLQPQIQPNAHIALDRQRPPILTQIPLLERVAWS